MATVQSLEIVYDIFNIDRIYILNNKFFSMMKINTTNTNTRKLLTTNSA